MICTICGEHELERHDIGGDAFVFICPKVRPGQMRHTEDREIVCNPEVVEDPNFEATKADNDAWKSKMDAMQQAGSALDLDAIEQHLKDCVEPDWQEFQQVIDYARKIRDKLFVDLPEPHTAYDEDHYCTCCGNGDWKPHSPDCYIADLLDRIAELEGKE